MPISLLIPSIIRVVGEYLYNDLALCKFYAGTGMEFKARSFCGKCSKFNAPQYEIRRFECVDYQAHECRVDFDCSQLEIYDSCGFIDNLEHLRGSPLRSIKLGFNGALDPLRTCTLKPIVSYASNGSLEPRGMRIKNIRLPRFIGSLEPLRGAPLEFVYIRSYSGNLDALRDAPLKIIYMDYFNDSLEPLFECKSIKFIHMRKFCGDAGPLAYAFFDQKR